MKAYNQISITTALLLGVVLLYPGPSQAQLGQLEQNAVRQSQSLNLPRSASHEAAGFRYTEFSSADLTVKDYVNPQTKTVFGITWKGTRMPSLVRLLGFDPHKIKGPNVSRSLHSASIRTDNLSIDLVDILGYHAGRAVRTDLLPGGISVSVVSP